MSGGLSPAPQRIVAFLQARTRMSLTDLAIVHAAAVNAVPILRFDHLPLSLIYAIRGVYERSGGIEYLGLPVVFNSHVHWGFFNFLLGLVGFLCAFGLWLRLRGRPANIGSRWG